MKRVPSFSERPGFPCGLRVLLVESDVKNCQATEAQLKECNYCVSACSSSAQALNALTSASSSFDVLLVEARTICTKLSDNQKLLRVAKDLPLILMAEKPSSDEVMSGIKLGAAEFLEKPLCPLKLRNIWQHTVRKMLMSSGAKDMVSGQPPHSGSYLKLLMD